MDNFGFRLKKTLEEKGITQKDLAQKAQTTDATISRYINNERIPGAVLLEKIATALSVTSDFLLGKDTGSSFSNKAMFSDLEDIPDEVSSAVVQKIFQNYGIIRKGEKLNAIQLDILLKTFSSIMQTAKDLPVGDIDKRTKTESAEEIQSKYIITKAAHDEGNLTKKEEKDFDGFLKKISEEHKNDKK